MAYSDRGIQFEGPDYIQVDDLNEVPIYLEKNSGKFVCRIGNDFIRRKDLAACRSEVNQRSRGSVQAVSRPHFKGRISQDGYRGRSRKENDLNIYGRWYELKLYDGPDVLELIQAATKDNYGRGSTNFRTRDGQLLSGPFCHPAPEVFEKLKALSRRQEEANAHFDAEWDALIDQLPEFTAEQIKAELAASRQSTATEAAMKVVRAGPVEAAEETLARAAGQSRRRKLIPAVEPEPDVAPASLGDLFA